MRATYESLTCDEIYEMEVEQEEWVVKAFCPECGRIHLFSLVV